MINNLIFDFGNVVIQFIQANIVSKVTTDPTEHALLLEAVFGKGKFEETDRGLITADEHKKITKQELPEYLHKKADELLEVWYLDLPITDGMEQLLKDAKKAGYGIYLLSNINIQFAESTDKVPVLKLFDGIMLSSYVKHVKPEKEIYYALLDKYNLKAEECMFVDDREINVHGGEAVGIKGYLFDGDTKTLRDYINSNNDMISKI